MNLEPDERSNLSLKATTATGEEVRKDVFNVGSGNKKYVLTVSFAQLQCEYETLELPCKLCKERGFECGEEQKVKGPISSLDDRKGRLGQPDQIVFAKIPQKPRTPPEEMLTDLDRRYLGHLKPKLYGGADEKFLLNGEKFQDTGARWQILSIRVPDFQFSKAFRFSYLAFAAAYIAPDSVTSDHLEYMGRFHTYIKEAICLSSFTEVFMASYMALVFEFVRPTLRTLRIKNMAVYANGMLKCLSHLRQNNDLTVQIEMQKLNIYCYSSFCYMFQQYSQVIGVSGPTVNEIEGFHDLSTSLVGYSRIAPPEDYTVIENLRLCLIMELHSFLTLRKSSSQGTRSLVSSVKETIQDIVDQIMFRNRYPREHELIGIAGDESQGHPWNSVSLHLTYFLQMTSF
jgi:hypothetical protein